eukprot:1185669-Rhodomonas_salina.1
MGFSSSVTSRSPPTLSAYALTLPAYECPRPCPVPYTLPAYKRPPFPVPHTLSAYDLPPPLPSSRTPRPCTLSAPEGEDIVRQAVTAGSYSTANAGGKQISAIRHWISAASWQSRYSSPVSLSGSTSVVTSLRLCSEA